MVQKRIRIKLAKGERTEDGCLLVDYNHENSITVFSTACPDKCGAVYGRAPSQGHRVRVRTTFVVKSTALFESSPAEAWKFAQQTIDEDGRKRDISHLCRSGSSQLCLEPSHFELASQTMNMQQGSGDHIYF